MNYSSCLYSILALQSMLGGIPLTSHSVLRVTMVRLRLSRFQEGPASTTGFLAMTAELWIDYANGHQFC